MYIEIVYDFLHNKFTEHDHPTFYSNNKFIGARYNDEGSYTVQVKFSRDADFIAYAKTLEGVNDLKREWMFNKTVLNEVRREITRRLTRKRYNDKYEDAFNDLLLDSLFVINL